MWTIIFWCLAPFYGLAALALLIIEKLNGSDLPRNEHQPKHYPGK